MNIKSISSHWIFNALSVGIPIFLIPILIRKIGIDSYGALALMQIVASALTTIVDFGFGVIGSTILARVDSNDRSKIATNLFACHLGILILCFGIGMVAIWGANSAIGYGLFSMVIANVFFIYAPPSYIIFLLDGQYKYGVHGAAGKVLHAAVVVLFSNQSNGAFLYFFVATVIGAVNSYSFFVLLKTGGVRIDFKYFDKKIFLNNLSEGFKFFTQRLSTLIPALGIPIMLSSIGAKSDVAVYSIIDKLKTLIWQAVSPIILGVAPKIFLAQHESSIECKRLLLRAFYFVGSVAVLLSLISTIFSRSILYAILGAHIEGAYLPWMFGSVGMIFGAYSAYSNLIVFPLANISIRLSIFLSIYGLLCVLASIIIFQVYSLSGVVVVIASADILIVLVAVVIFLRKRELLYG